MDGIRDRLNRGVQSASERLLREQGPESEVEVMDLRCTALGSLSPEELCGDGDRVAAVSCALRGGLGGTAVFAMEPEDALAWVLSSGSGSDPLASFVASGECILRQLAESTGETEPRPELAAGALREESLMEILVGTHAPSDTLVLSAQLEVRTETLCLPAAFHLLVAPKQFSQLGGEATIEK